MTGASSAAGWRSSARMNKVYNKGVALFEPSNRGLLCKVVVGFVCFLVVAWYVWDFLTFWYFAGENHFVLPPYIDRPKHYWSQHAIMHTLRATILTFTHGSDHSYKFAQKYFEEQKPFFIQSAKEFQLHPAFAGVSVEISPSFYDMVAARMTNLRSNWDKYHWDDFKIEKDKCVALSFISNNSFPHSRSLGIWTDASLLLDMLPQVLASNTKWPLFLKTCHLTAGADNSVFRPPLSSLEDYNDRKEKLATFVWEKWNQRSNDYERSWSADANVLTATLQPGFILQTPASFTLELKIEVIWGRVYVLFVDGSEGHTITRDGLMQFYHQGTWKEDWLNQHSAAPSELEWIVQEGHHLRCIELAEKFARTVGIDEIRVDIFIKKGFPMAAMVNEDSISSGGQYRSHFSPIAEIWAMGHRDRLYKIKSTNVPAYAAATDVEYRIPRYGGGVDYATMSADSQPYLVTESQFQDLSLIHI
eukprot:TRINITY_DN12124_c0_g2_i1.p1 TRINITY_DN12124_c0_g2~~TRINITY_DN12124_c0_g2_i1.p1  ORF type:complete len:474 (-),score=75.57 TRINITY_DN12124_c0_g2_i1:179-1600(-)